MLAEYGYDPFGRRLWKEVDGVRTYFLYSDEGLVAEYDKDGNELRSYGYKPDSTWTTNPLFLKQDDEYFFYQNDHLGTPQKKLVDETGVVVWAAIYDVFGQAQITVDDVENNLRFPGQYFDTESGLHYNWNRYYDPESSRYTQVDPIGFDGRDANLYAFVCNNPVNWVDPWGLFNWKKLPNTSFVINPTGENVLVSGNDPGSGQQQQWVMPPYSISLLLDTPFENNDIDAVYYGDQVITLSGLPGFWVHLPNWLRPSDYDGFIGDILRLFDPVFDPQGAEDEFEGPINPPTKECSVIND